MAKRTGWGKLELMRTEEKKMEIEGDHLVRGSGGAEEERRREVAPVDGQSPREKPQQPGAGEQRPPCSGGSRI